MEYIEEKKDRVIYVAGSLRNRQVPIIANQLRKDMPNAEIFDSWYYSHENADDWLRDCCKAKGLNYKQTLQDHAARHVFEFDAKHLNRATDIVLVMPAGKSCFLELGFSLGKGKRGFVYFNEPQERIDIMMQFCTDLFFSFDELVEGLKKYS